MQVTFLGVRGSTPAPGASFVRYGGHTSCVAVATGPGADPTLVLDAGTGLRELSAMLGGRAFRGDLLLSHLHWDHVQGIPFFLAGDRQDAVVRVAVPAQDGRSGRDLMAQQLSPPVFPITPEGLAGRWSWPAVAPGPVPVADFAVVACDVAHKGGRTLGYRVTSGNGATLAYAPDHAPAAGVSDALLELMGGVDVLVHDAQFLAHERGLADAYGHATLGDALALATQVGAGTLVAFHHGPGRTDAALDEMARQVAATGAGPRVVLARQGMVLDLAGPGDVAILPPGAGVP